mgnify:CR=1 FL=1
MTAAMDVVYCARCGEPAGHPDHTACDAALVLEQLRLDDVVPDLGLRPVRVQGDPAHELVTNEP